jgi:hypothetical protein
MNTTFRLVGRAARARILADSARWLFLASRDGKSPLVRFNLAERVASNIRRSALARIRSERPKLPGHRGLSPFGPGSKLGWRG